MSEQRFYLILNYPDYGPQTYSWEVPSIFHNWTSDMLSGNSIANTTRELFWEFARETKFTPTHDMEFLVIEFRTEEDFTESMSVFDRIDCSTGDLGRDDVQLILRTLLTYPKYFVKVSATPPAPKLETKKQEPKSFWR